MECPSALSTPPSGSRRGGCPGVRTQLNRATSNEDIKRPRLLVEAITGGAARLALGHLEAAIVNVLKAKSPR
ncbi:unnamed protein product [Nezara viridula]|uniref:Uncharacterized protein n=1 Tax=Nezara viridula TaxID=85310 RepID=A0A9P0HQ33_NEZVI|nr:unnamed protein product [Nezara viridula]